MHLPIEFGRYTLVEKIARGGTAEIYRANFSSPGGFSKTVAIKRLLQKFVGHRDLEEMLIDEARVLTHLRHQSIVQVLDLGNCNGVPFIAMEFIDGIDCARLLREVIRDGTSLSLQHALYIIEQVLRALEFAHRCVGECGEELSIVHRDISPSNILLSFNGEVKLTDFGIARGGHRTNLTAVGQIKGKYSYMAPEQARGASLDGRADIFACGVVLAELLTAKRMFDGANDLEVLEKVRSVCVTDGMLDEIPAPVRAIIILAMAKDPEIRYRNAAWMLEDVRRAAVKLEVQSSSLELSSYIRTMFPMEFRRDRPTSVSSIVSDDVTKVCRLPSGARGIVRSRISRVLKTAGMVVIMGLLMPISSSRGRAIDRVPLPNDKPQKNVELSKTKKPDRVVVAPKGVIAIDSVPRGASGRLVIGMASYDIVTPFAMGNLDIGDGVAGSVELSLKGYEPHKKSIELTPSAPTFTRKVKMSVRDQAKLSVHARPWGVVTVAGCIKAKETPVNNVLLGAGKHIVKVYHPPSGKTLTKKVLFSGGSSVRCNARFDGEPSMSCR